MKLENLMNLTKPLAFAALSIGMFLSCGCEGPAPAKPQAAAASTPNRAEQMQMLEQQAVQFHQQVAQLPGSDSEQHRQIAGTALDSLAKILALAQGPSPTLDFANHLDTVEASRAAIQQADVSTHRAEAAENEAIRASIDSLEQIAVARLPDDHRLAELVDAARGTLGQLYSQSGPFHDLSAAKSFTAVDRIVERLSQDFNAHSTGVASTNLNFQPPV
jgi:hypothetical protein